MVNTNHISYINIKISLTLTERKIFQIETKDCSLIRDLLNLYSWRSTDHCYGKPKLRNFRVFI
jgi:hypothetical protein